MTEIKEPKIRCQCDDVSCPIEGVEGEVSGHIDNCPCAECHRAMGKI